NRADVLRRVEINDDPLRVQRIVLTREFLGQIRIAFPVGRRISVGQARVFVGGVVAAGVSAMRERISEGMPQKLLGLGASREVAALLRGVAPGSVGIP